MIEEKDYFNYDLEPGKIRNKKSINYSCKDKPLISIFTAYYNCKKYIRQTANSVLNQTFPFWEWIIVDDGSTEEGTKELLDSLQKEDSRIKVYYQENQGRIKARDAAISHTSADILYMLDSDDLLDKTLLECGYWTLYTNPHAAWAYTNCVNFGDVQFLYKPDFNSEQEKIENLVIGSSFIRKKQLLEVGCYGAVDNDVHEDWHLWLRMLEKGYYPVKMNYYGFWYRKREGSTLSSISKNKKREEHAQEVISQQARRINHYINPIQYPVSTGDAYKSYPNVFNWSKKPIFDKSKKNLLFILPWFIFGGADKFNYDLISNLDQNKYNITIITTEPSEYIWRQKFEAYAEIYDLSTFLHRKDWASFIHYIIQSRNIDLVMVSNCYYAYYAIPWLKSEFPKVIFTDYIHAHDWSWRNGGYPRDSIAIYNFLDRTYTCNDYVKNIMIQQMDRKPDKIDTVYVGVDTNYFNPTKKDCILDDKIMEKIKNKKVILFICRIVELKRPIFILKVLKRILEKDTDYILLVVGDGEQLREMKNFAKNMNLTNNVIFCGMQTDTWNFYKIANISIICSLTEGLAITSYESLAMGVPVITSDVGGQSELIDDSCGKVIKTYQDVTKDLFNRNYDEKEIDEYANAILNIINSNRYNSIKKACIDKIEKSFSVKNMVNILDESFTELIQNGTKVDKSILNNKEFFKQYIVMYNALDIRKYHTDIGGIASRKEINRYANLRDRLWAHKSYRTFFKILKAIGVIKLAKKIVRRFKKNK